MSRMIHAGQATAPPLLLVTESREGDSELVTRAQRRDERAFEQLYRLHVGRVHAVCLRLTADARDAEEMTQRAFVTAWQKLPLFRAESAFGSWLHRLAVNTVLSAMRADRRREQRVFAVEHLPECEAAGSVPRPTGDRLDLEAAIAALPPQARIVFVLHDVEGWKHDEIAAQLGLASGTSKAQLHRARKILQEALQ